MHTSAPTVRPSDGGESVLAAARREADAVSSVGRAAKERAASNLVEEKRDNVQMI
jgi:hypothetical protein